MKIIKKLVYSVIALFLLIILNATMVNASSTKINAPENVKVSVSGVTNAKVKWSSVGGAKKYTIYRATSKKGKYKKVGTSQSTSFKNKNLTRGKTYYYKIVANGVNSNSKKSSYAKVKILTKSQVLKKIRNALKDKTWVKNNVKMKYTAFDSKFKGKQTLYFGKIKNKELVAVEAVSEENYSVQMFLVGYKDGKIKATTSSRIPVHYYHGGPSIDLDNGIAAVTSLHMGYYYDQFFKVTSVKFKELDKFEDNSGAMSDDVFYKLNGKKVSEKKYNDTFKKYSKYKCSSLSLKGGYKLTNNNLDKYLK